MPRTSPFEIILTGEERDRLRSLARKYTAPYRDVIRAQVILLAADGLENKEIGKKLNLPRKTVSKWRKRFFYKRQRGLVDEPRDGRPFFFPPEEVAEIKALACQLPAERGIPLSRFSITEIVREVISRAIVQKKVLTPNDFPNLRAVKKRLLDFQIRYQELARPFHWKFTRKDLKERLKLVSDNLIKQYEPVVFEDVVTEEFLSRNQAGKPQSVYAYT